MVCTKYHGVSSVGQVKCLQFPIGAMEKKMDVCMNEWLDDG